MHWTNLNTGLRRLLHDGTLAAHFEPRANAFGFLRLCLASGVLISHAYVLGGLGPEPLTGFSEDKITLGTACVMGFFAISGFLIMLSMWSGRSISQFLWNRFLRIFPGYVVCLLVMLVFFFPLFCWLENRSVMGFFEESGTQAIGYVTANLFLAIQQWTVPPLMASAPYPLGLNGSLWSLIYEWRCYLLVAGAGVIFRLRHGAITVSTLCILIWALAIAHVQHWSLSAYFPGWFNDGVMTSLASYFAIASLFALWLDRIPNSAVLFALSVLVVAVALRTNTSVLIAPPAVAYGVLWLAMNLPKQLAWFDRVGDVSYGVYIYAFPVQQGLAVAGAARWGAWPYIGLSFAATLVLALLSYRLIERPALRLKRLVARLTPGALNRRATT